jgi:DNA polymerase-3 subunit gamma/tau
MTESDAVVDTPEKAHPYRVLARKYRPAGFDTLIGQEALVRTLTNAFRSGRLAHAYMLSGVRGVGKTTTARIIARALNCVGPDGAGGPTATPCGVCDHCRSIADDRHVDVLEMDAASRTGVDDIRELIEGVRYRPTSARYKVYIIDEVHMLSKNAFNALLKTLEEPPEHVRFVFATTELRKVPVTVLSRCQRFDLRRVDAAELAEHLAGIVEKENADVSKPALQLIARAADGSVRDGLSLLDQAISHSGGAVDEEAVRDMLGLADRTVTFDLLEAVLGGDIKVGLTLLAEQCAAGADPTVVLNDMLELIHWLTRIKIAPESADAPGVPEAERGRGRQMAERLSMADVTRAWQMLLKGLGETRTAPSPLQAAEMVLVRLAYAAGLPTPAEALKTLGGQAETPAGSRTASKPPVARASGPQPMAPSSSSQRDPSGPRAALAEASPRRSPDETTELPVPTSFQQVVDLAADHKEAILQGHLTADVQLVRFEPGCIEMCLGERAPSDLPGRLSRFLNEHTALTWLVSISQETGASTLLEQRRAAENARLEEARKHPLVQAVMEIFPGATIDHVRGPRPSHDDPPQTDQD